VHQLTSAFHTMSLCTRPLLIAGFKAAAGDEEFMAIDPLTSSLTPEQVRSHVTYSKLAGLGVEPVCSVVVAS